MKRKKPCTGDHVIAPATTVVTTCITTKTVISTAAADNDEDNEQLCLSMSPAEEPVQMSHKRLPVPAAANRLRHRPIEDLRASRLIDQYVDQIRMDDGTLGGPRDRLSIVSPLAKRLADIRLRRSPSEAHCKRKRTMSDDDDCPQTPVTMHAGKRPTAAWWWQCSGGSGLTMPDGLPSPFHHHHNPSLTVPPSPITPLRRRRPDQAADDSDDYWKTPVGPSLIMMAVGRDSLLSTTASSKTANDDDDIIGCYSDPRSPAVLDETFTLKSRRCLSFVSPPPSDKKKNRRSLKKPTTAALTSVDKGKP